MRISDWSSDVCSSDLRSGLAILRAEREEALGDVGPRAVDQVDHVEAGGALDIGLGELRADDLDEESLELGLEAGELLQHRAAAGAGLQRQRDLVLGRDADVDADGEERKSTRLNSSH